MRKTPYTATIGTGACRRLEGSEGFWGKFPDPFDPRLSAMLKMRPFSDPWCIGFFVDNELSWGADGVSLAVATLRSPQDQPAKRMFLDDLRKKYQTIEKLNAAWGTQHASWHALLQSTTPPDKKKARPDLEAFYTRLAEQYFAVCRAAVKKAAPHQLYLGCRFATLWQNERATRASAKYCDVVSFNIYKRASDLRLPEGADRPILIGEFHFGALDRGLFHPGLVAAPSQECGPGPIKNTSRVPWRTRPSSAHIGSSIWTKPPPDEATGRTSRLVSSMSATRPTGKSSTPRGSSPPKCIRSG